MVEQRVYIERRPGAHVLGAVLVSLIIIIGALWMMGVITVAKNGSQVVITVDFSKAEKASQDAADKTGQALERAGEKLREKSHPTIPATESPVQQPVETTTTP
jgi:hypothetical protein